MAESLPDPMFFYVQHAGGMLSLFRDEDKASDCAERSCGPRPYYALFTADQMRAYAAEAVKAEREPMTDEQLDTHLDAILRAAGSALRHYTMHKSREDMRAALRAALGQQAVEPKS